MKYYIQDENLLRLHRCFYPSFFKITNKKNHVSHFFFTKFKCLLGELALATRGGRLIGWKDAREYARLSLYFVRNKLTLLK